MAAIVRDTAYFEAAFVTEIERLRAQRDYYRRRWIIRGVRWPQLFGWPRNALSALIHAREDDDCG